MLKQTLAIAALLAVAGCASDDGGMASAPSHAGTMKAATLAPTVATPMQNQQAVPVQAELAAYAGGHAYPSSQQVSGELRAAALVSPDQSLIKIYNFDSQPIREADVWVNKQYVRHVSVIAPGSSVSLQFSNLYNAVGQQFSTRGDHVNSVQIQQSDTLHSLMGPLVQ